MTDKSHKAVPREPTQEMLQAGREAMRGYPVPGVTHSINAAWQRMYDAAPVLATAPAEPPKGLTNEQFSDAEHAAFNAREIVEKLVCAVATEGFFGSEMAPRRNCKCWNCLNARVLNACATSINAALNVIANCPAAAPPAAPAEPPKDGEAPPLVRQPKMARQEAGWICPACRRVNGPQVRECACRGNLTLGERLRRANT